MQDKAAAVQQTAGQLIRRGITRSITLLTGAKPDNGTEPVKTTELQMVWPHSRLAQPPTWTTPESYRLRTYQPGDENCFFKLMDRVGFPGWTMPIFDTWLQKILPDGLFFLVHRGTGALAATAMACHNPTPLHPFGATLSCVGVDPDHRGLGLGTVVTAAVTRRLIDGGYKEIYMETLDWRLPAIKIYLTMGWVPLLFQANMPKRWQVVCETLRWPYEPEAWADLPPHRPSMGVEHEG